MGRRTGSDLADDLSRSWHDLGRVLASRRLLASLHPDARALTPTKLRALDVIGGEDSVRVGELAGRMGIDETTATRLVDRLVAAGGVPRGGGARGPPRPPPGGPPPRPAARGGGAPGGARPFLRRPPPRPA